MYRHYAANHLFLTYAFDDIARLEIHQHRIPRVRNFVVQALDLREGLLQTVPLRCIAITPGRNGEWVGEGCVVAPEGEFGKRRPP